MEHIISKCFARNEQKYVHSIYFDKKIFNTNMEI